MNIVICDSSTFKYHRHGGGQKGSSNLKEEVCCGLTTKLHLAITPDFHIIEGYLTGGNRADISCADDLTASVSGCYIIDDKGYDSNNHRMYLLSNNNIPVIPGRKIALSA